MLAKVGSSGFQTNVQTTELQKHDNKRLSGVQYDTCNNIHGTVAFYYVNLILGYVCQGADTCETIQESS